MHPFDAPRIQFFSLRKRLLRINEDLLTIHDAVKSSSLYLTDSSNIEMMTMFLEDKRYLSHYGLDLYSVIREVVKAASFRKHGGASTIDMQFVRTCTGFRDRTISRKLYEILLAFIIQFRYSKRQVLHSYLSCAYFGSGLIGVERASMRVFKKRADNLTMIEASFIASMLVSPMPLSPSPSWYSRVVRRALYGQRIRISHEESLKELKITKLR